MQRVPTPTPGRNRWFERLWQALTGYQRVEGQGYQRPFFRVASAIRPRDFDLEIPEFPIRDRDRAQKIIEICHNQPEARYAIRSVARDTFSSEDGDDRTGLRIEDRDQNDRPVDPQYLERARAVLRQRLPISLLQAIVARAYGYGDAFVSLYLTSRPLGVGRVLLLPTWEMFRLETDQGELLGFQQRRRLDDPDPISIHPWTCVHFRWSRQSLYGQSQFAALLADWDEYRAAVADARNARRAIGANPTIHFLPPEYTPENQEFYRQQIEDLQSEGVLTDIYAPPGVEIRKLASSDPNLKAISEALVDSRKTFARASGLPLWMFAGLDSTGAREILSGPSLAYSRTINAMRQMIAEGVREILIRDLCMYFGLRPDAVPPLSLEFPEFIVRPQDTASAAPTEEGKEDEPKSGNPDMPPEDEEEFEKEEESPADMRSLLKSSRWLP